MEHGMYAAELFLKGYNCAQAVAMAFCDVTGLDEKTTARMVSSFGGGMGRLREVCGAVSGMLFVAGYLYGYDTYDDDVAKKAHYTLVQELAGRKHCLPGDSEKSPLRPQSQSPDCPVLCPAALRPDGGAGI